MKLYRPTLQRYFSQELPNAEALAEALTFHAFEIESALNEVLDVKVTANRGHDCLCHRGIAKELAAILDMKMLNDPLRAPAPQFRKSEAVRVAIDEPELCSRYIAGYIRRVQVQPSPQWLQKELEAIGQRSINNVVDATNYVMFTLGQPLHAFDAGMLSQKDEAFAIAVRKARQGEKMVALDGKEYALTDSTLVITDAHDDVAIGIAGVKGGAPAAISETTTDIIIESANFDGVSVRRSAQMLKLRTDASIRFEQVISPEVAAYGMQAVVELILQLAGGDVEGFVDEYVRRQELKKVSVSVGKVNQVLGTGLSASDIAETFSRLDLTYSENAEAFTVDVPFERLDLIIAEDLVEEVGRIIGYDAVPATELPVFRRAPGINENFYWAERIRAHLVSKGFSEVYTSVFAEKGDRIVLNKVDAVRPYLRDCLRDGLHESLKRNLANLPLLGLSDVRLFEIGTVFEAGKERMHLVIGAIGKSAPKCADIFHELKETVFNIPDEFNSRENVQTSFNVVEVDAQSLIDLTSTGKDSGNPAWWAKLKNAGGERAHWEALARSGKNPFLKNPYSDVYEKSSADHVPPLQDSGNSKLNSHKYQPFSKYPFVVRDIALWVPEGESAGDVLRVIRASAGELIVRSEKFDEFKKVGRTSFAFRLVFQSFDKTLTDGEVNERMESVYGAVKAKGWEVR